MEKMESLAQYWVVLRGSQCEEQPQAAVGSVVTNRKTSRQRGGFAVMSGDATVK